MIDNKKGERRGKEKRKPMAWDHGWRQVPSAYKRVTCAANSPANFQELPSKFPGTLFQRSQPLAEPNRLTIKIHKSSINALF